ncbi:hypothetical protein [Mycolicibacterium nivoides]|uniref:hypothetical protein n=1 Tax=Mycolicibacterium nivoides TaxID=2487344 RepID=UPI003C2E2808
MSFIATNGDESTLLAFRSSDARFHAAVASTSEITMLEDAARAARVELFLLANQLIYHPGWAIYTTTTC